MSNSRSTNTGAPQGYVLSPLLFSLYTNDCTSKDPSVKLLKFADDTTVISLIQDGDESAYRQEVKELAVWCTLNNLELNTLKTVEMIMGLQEKNPCTPPTHHHKQHCDCRVETFKFLGSIISQDLKWDTHINSIVKKSPTKVVLPSPAEEVNLPQKLLETVILSRHWVCPVHFNNCLVWLSYKIRDQKTTENGSDCWTDYRCPPCPPFKNCKHPEWGKGSENHSGSLPSKSSPFVTFAIWPALQSPITRTARHKNSFLPPGNLPYEQL